jgi:hypothetical protein
MGRLDRVPTRTRLARQGTSTIRKSPARMTPGRATRPTLFTNSETKVRAFNATTHHGYNSNQRGSSTGVKSCIFTAHPEMGDENLSLYAPYRALFRH